jgi:hypothetical protein
METLAQRTPRHIVDNPGEDINPWSDDIWMDAHLLRWPPNTHCTMTDLLQLHTLLQDNAHDPSQHYLHTYFIHPNLCHWPLALSPSHLMPHIPPSYHVYPFSLSSADLFIRCLTSHFSDRVIHHSYIYQSTLLNKCCCI